MDMRKRSRYYKHPEFNGLGDIVWEYLCKRGMTLHEINDRDILMDPINRNYADEPVWHQKSDLDQFAARQLNLKYDDYNYRQGYNYLYNAVVGEIKYLREKGLIVDLRHTDEGKGVGVWRLAIPCEDASEQLTTKEMHEGNFYSKGNLSMIRVRHKQQAFKRMLMERDRYQCLFCRFDLRDWMTGAHIVPYWYMSEHDPDNAMNPSNGLLLCKMCDVAFEDDYIMVEQDYGITITDRLHDHRSPAVRSWIGNVATELRIADRDAKYLPGSTYLKKKKEMAMAKTCFG